MKESKETSLFIGATPEFIARRIMLIRGQKVMLDSELAELYQVTTGNLNKAVRRNIQRFPKDFMFRLHNEESKSLIFQFGISNTGRGGSRHDPYVFTELGVAMLSSVLNSDRAVQMNIFIMRAFVKLREMLATHADLAEKIGELEKKQKAHGGNLAELNFAVKKLIEANTPTHDVMGFQVDLA
jgi:hypothetical protein